MNSFVRRLTPILITKWTQSAVLAISVLLVSISITYGQVLPPSTNSSGQEDPVSPPSAKFNAAAYAAQPPLCGFGVNGGIAGFDTTPLRISWYVNYVATSGNAPPSEITHFPMIHLTQTGPESYTYSILSGWVPASETELKNLVAKNPGSWWLIGNEPDRPNRAIGGQDDLEPQVYAIAYHDLYYLIKSADPSAKIVVGNIVQPSPIRLRYLDKVLSTYYSRYGEALRADAWGIHNFILKECQDGSAGCWGAGIPPGFNGDEHDAMNDLPISANDDFELFKEQIVRFRQWLADRGYRGAPVFLSEYGVLMPDWIRDEHGVPFTSDRINAFMTKSFDYLLNEAIDPDLGDPADGYRLIQRFSWYSVADDSFNGYLHEASASDPNQFVLSPMGVNFANYVSGIPEVVEPYPVRIDVSPGAPLASSGNVTFTLSALVANSGNHASGKMFPVRFFDGDPAAGGIQIGGDQTVTLTGCGDNASVQVQWPNIEPGDYQVYVQVDPSGANKIIDKRIGFANEQIFNPSVMRGLYLH